MSVGVLTSERDAHHWEHKKLLSYQDAFCEFQAIHMTVPRRWSARATLGNKIMHFCRLHSAGDSAFLNNKSFNREKGVPLKHRARIVVTIRLVSCFLTSNGPTGTSDSLYKSLTPVFTHTYNIISLFFLERAPSFF